MRLVLAIVAVVAATESSVTGAGVFLKTTATGSCLVLNDVFLNGEGPFRMLLDTGNATSIVRPKVAQRLKLRPIYAVEHATVASVRRVPAALLEVLVGIVKDSSVEAIVDEVARSGVDGVLGANWLVRHDYLLDYRNRRIALDDPPPSSGVRVPLRLTDGRPAVMASINGRSRELVVDSGASHVVLFERPSTGDAAVLLDVRGAATRAWRVTV